jgi:hypothetical protein
MNEFQCSYGINVWKYQLDIGIVGSHGWYETCVYMILRLVWGKYIYMNDITLGPS